LNIPRDSAKSQDTNSENSDRSMGSPKSSIGSPKSSKSSPKSFMRSSKSRFYHTARETDKIEDTKPKDSEKTAAPNRLNIVTFTDMISEIQASDKHEIIEDKRITLDEINHINDFFVSRDVTKLEKHTSLGEDELFGRIYSMIDEARAKNRK